MSSSDIAKLRLLNQHISFQSAARSPEDVLNSMGAIQAQDYSEATGYTANITSGPTWSMDHVLLNATLTFNWTTGYSAHPVAIEWFSAPPSMSNSTHGKMALLQLLPATGK